jgi:predicted nucleotidyltransferase
MEGIVLSELRDMMRRRLESPLVISAALFGSIVEGRETPRSDIDLLVVTNQKGKVEEIIEDLQKDVSERFGNPISAYYVLEGDLEKKRKESPVKQVLESHVLICGKTLR